MAGNGALKKKIAPNDATASPTYHALFSARLPILSTAWTTTANTAAASPANTARTVGTSPHAAYASDSARIDTKPGSTNSTPATSPPTVPCSSHPTYVTSCVASGPGSSMQ